MATSAPDQDQIAAVVRAVLAELGRADAPTAAGDAGGGTVIAPLQIDSPQERGEVGGDAKAPGPATPRQAGTVVATMAAPRPFRRARHAADGLPFAASEVAKMRAATPARILQGRVGTRYPTDKAIGLRAEHAVALDAVQSALPADFAARLGCLELRTKAENHEEYLAFPDKGRALCPESRAALLAHGSKGVDVQVICGDGLAAWALEANAPALLPALQRSLTAAGFSLGQPLLVHHARVGVQDEIGVALGAKCTIILVGERPGLGTGDSLSIYTAFGPKLRQDNAEKDCISNIRPLGIPAEEAAEMTAALLRRTFAAGGGGVHLTSQADAS